MNGSRVNVVLLAVTVVAVAFGVYGFLFGGSVTPAPVTEPAPVHPGHDQRARAGTSDTEHDTPDDDPMDGQKPDKPKAKTPAGDTSQPGPDESPAPEAPPQPHGDGVIEGTVLDPTGNPMEGVPLTALRISAQGGGQKVVYSSGRNASAEDLRRAANELRLATRQAVSGKDGMFKIEGVAPHDLYDVSALDDTWGNAERNGVVAGQRVVLQFVLSDITSGTVHDAEGNPLVTRYSYSWGTRFNPERGRQPSGRFVIRWTSERLKFVRLECAGFVPSSPMDRSCRNRRDLKIVLDRAPQLQGTVVSPDGQPVQSAIVAITPSPELDATLVEGENERQSDALGRFQFTSLPPCKYTVTATLRGGTTTASSEIDLQQDFKLELVLDPGPTLRVRVLDAEKRPVGGTSASLRDQSGDWIQTTALSTEIAGEYLFLGMPASPLQLHVSAPGYAVQWFDVDPRSGSQELQVTLLRGGTLTGRVVDGASVGVPDILLTFRPDGADVGQREQTTNTDSKGEYTISGLMPGNWTVDISRAWGEETIASDTLMIADGANQRDFTVRESSRIRIKCTLEDQAHGDWIHVWIYPEDADEPQEEWFSAGNRQPVVTLKEGAYFIASSTNSHASRMVQVRVGPGETEVALPLHTPNALRIDYVESGSGLSRAGAKAGDLILTYNEQEVRDRTSLLRLATEAASRPEVTEVAVVVQRGAKQVSLKWPKTLAAPVTSPGFR